ncbi:hypothetical protein ASE01_02125 [Nocardioides sp. Root190]|uniref:hypothetical protein n=1 Tax=Nocardioides sp. Root190 TaxID=1736488 RepID=UPI0006F9E6F2|nr:hypothetical protein [Nocardioides sp. Root190]KRB80306.1 hypothetical protein ASE01_02125 [Nocardioides sp. Root190]
MSRSRDLVRALRRAHRLPDELGPRVEDLEKRLGDAVREIGRIGPQVAALEERLEALRRRVEEPAPTGSPEDVAAARTVLEEVRAEHARVRARISAAVVFEERLRVLEAKAGVDPVTGRDV